MSLFSPRKAEPSISGVLSSLCAACFSMLDSVTSVAVCKGNMLVGPFIHCLPFCQSDECVMSLTETGRVPMSATLLNVSVLNHSSVVLSLQFKSQCLSYEWKLEGDNSLNISISSRLCYLLQKFYFLLNLLRYNRQCVQVLLQLLLL